MSDVTETDLTTDPPTIVERSFTESEVEQKALDATAIKTQAAAKKAQLQIVSDARAFALSLGFTDAMLAVMYPNLAP
jgi:hypothetical protein